MIDQDDLMKLTGEQQQAYMSYIRIFESEAWAELVEWAKKQHTLCIGKELVASKWEDILTARGERRGYIRIAEMEQATHNEYLALVEEAKEQEITNLESENE